MSRSLSGPHARTRAGRKRPPATPRVKEIPVSFVRRLPLVDKACAVCGRPFRGASTRTYCGLVCKNRANYRQHAEQRRAERREKYHAEKSAAAGKT